MDIEEKKDVVFIDAYNLIYRAYHGNQNRLTNEDGLLTNAIFTVSTMLLKLRTQFSNIVYTLAVFDGGGNFRKELDEDYKANRKPMPDELKEQMPYIKEAFDILGWPIMQAHEVEADDVIGTLALRAAKKDFNVYIVSGDKDFRQIVSENLNIIDTMHDICYNEEEVMKKMGVGPGNVVGWLALVGDKADNVKGVEGVGEQTATRLLTAYGSLEGIIDNSGEIKGKVGERIREAIESGRLKKDVELVTLKTDLELKISKKDVAFREIDSQRWVEFCKKMNFQSFLRRTNSM